MAVATKPYTTDAGFWHPETPSLPKNSGSLTLKSVKDCRLKATDRHIVRSKTDVRITGGYVYGAFYEGIPEKVTKKGRKRPSKKQRSVGR